MSNEPDYIPTMLVYIQEGLKGIAVFGSLAIIWFTLWAVYGH